MGTPQDIEATYRLQEGLYLLGSLEKGVTVYSQQVRAHNLVWALWELDRIGQRRLGRVAVVGGGVSGLTSAAGLLGLFNGTAPITLFERLWDLCPLQQGSDARWLHPRIYGWPAEGSRAPGASLPLLNWSEGRASDVARIILRAFGEYCQKFSTRADSLSVIVGLRHFRIRADTLEIEWIGTRAERDGAFFQLSAPVGDSAKFDTIILAAGFGIEREEPKYRTPSYWRNEQLGQPALNGQKTRHVVSGYGDGALVDLCRLTIERFRQDTIVYEIFGSKLEQVEQRLADELSLLPEDENLFGYFKSIEQNALREALRELARRLRKDTVVALHISGKNQTVKAFREIFGRTSSRLNRLLTYLLYRCGAFTVSFSDLATCVRQHGASSENVLCRHGADTAGHLQTMIADYETVETRLNEIRTSQAQTATRLWKPGSFPIVTGAYQR